MSWDTTELRGAMTRRQLLRRLAVLGLAGPLAAACQPATPAAPPTAVPQPKAPTQPPAPQPTKPAAQAAQPAAAPAKPAPAAPSGTITVVTAVTMVSLDPTIEAGMATFNPANGMFDTMLFRDEKGELQPHLVTSWSFPNDKTIRFKIRKGVKFHTGDEMTADDLVYTWTRVIDPAFKSLHRAYVKSIETVRKVDGETVELLLNEPDATVLSRFALVPVVPKKVYEGQPPEAVSQKPVGTGPWKFREWVKGQRVVMDANLDYWRGAPKIQTVVYKVIPESATRVTELLSGNADIVTALPPDMVDRVKGDSRTAVQEIQSLRNAYLRINTKKAPYNDVRVRQAINHAVDVKLITSTVMGGYGVPTPGGVMGTGVWGHPRSVNQGYEYSPEKAKKLLAEAGIPPGFKTSILIARGRLLADAEVVQAMGQMLRQVGFDVELKFMDFDTLLNEWSRKYREEMDLNFWSNANSTADADYNYTINFTAEGRAPYWYTTEFDAMVAKARQMQDRDARLKMYHEMGDYMFQQAPVGFLYDQVDLYGVSKRLQGFKARPDEQIFLYGASLAGS